MEQLKAHYRNILENGQWCPGRTGSTETDDASLAISGTTLRFNMKDGFPIATAKKVNWKAALEEMAWFIRGETNTQYLGNKIWDQWALKEDHVEKEWIPEQEYINLIHRKLGKEKISEIIGADPNLDQKAYHVELSNFFIRTGLSISTILTDEEMIECYGEEYLESQRAKLDYLRTHLDEIDPVEVVQKYGALIRTSKEGLHARLVEVFGIDPERTIKEMKAGYCGPIYGHQWRFWYSARLSHGIDQLDDAFVTLLHEPHSRRNVVSAWNVADLVNTPLPQPSNTEEAEASTQFIIQNEYMALPPCHYSFQFVCIGDKLDLILNMRSSDGGVGLPFNIVGYAFLLHLYASAAGKVANDLVINIGNAHIYRSHIDGIKEYLERDTHPLAKIEFTFDELHDKIHKRIHNEDYKGDELPELETFNQRGKFSFVLDNIEASDILEYIKDYVSEEGIKFDVHH